MTNDSSVSRAASPDETVGALLALAGYAADPARQARVAAEFARFAAMARSLEAAVADRDQAPLPVFRP
ncbi:AtzG-like protein [Bordetella genomosp. 13]|uniref:AtzG-like protein n=1 Tax=Bordetella genomosp. 13 TaxID=463040 RepID=UPI0016436358|nr:AtzG-like protein [Bordetella genomosp. 13]